MNKHNEQYLRWSLETNNDNMRDPLDLPPEEEEE